VSRFTEWENQNTLSRNPCQKLNVAPKLNALYSYITYAKNAISGQVEILHFAFPGQDLQVEGRCFYNQN